MYRDKMITHRNKRGDCTKTGQHSRRNNECDLWRGGQSSRLELSASEFLTRRLTIVLTLAPCFRIGRPLLSTPSGCCGTLTSMLRLYRSNRIQDATVIRTSAATVWGVNKGREVNSVEMMLPASAFTTIESSWSVASKLV